MTVPVRSGIETKVAIVELDRARRESIQHSINETTGLWCAATYRTAEDLLRTVPRSPVDVALISIDLPGISGIACTEQLRRILPRVEVIILADNGESETIFPALEAGASGYLWKDTPEGEIVQAIFEVLSGGAPMPGVVVRQVVKSFRRARPIVVFEEQLSRREEEILDYLVQGHATKEIASHLSVSYDTVRTHLKHIYGKLNVRSRTEAVIKRLNSVSAPVRSAMG